MRKGPLIRLHAGGVVRGGEGTLLVGDNGTGKSTLVTRLLEEGFELLSDDEVGIDPETLALLPTPRHILLKDDCFDFFPRYRERAVPAALEGRRAWWIDPEEIRPRCRAPSARFWGLVFLKPERKAQATLRPVGARKAFEALLEQCMNFPELGAEGVEVLARIATGRRRWLLTSGALEETVRLLDSHVFGTNRRTGYRRL